MSAATLTVPTTASSVHKTRAGLVALAVICLLAVSFVVGRWTADTTTTIIRRIVPTASAALEPSVVVPCRIGQPC
jgi:hypothetical protein